jgi:hypothetical protein
MVNAMTKQTTAVQISVALGSCILFFLLILGCIIRKNHIDFKFTGFITILKPAPISIMYLLFWITMCGTFAVINNMYTQITLVGEYYSDQPLLLGAILVGIWTCLGIEPMSANWMIYNATRVKTVAVKHTGSNDVCSLSSFCAYACGIMTRKLGFSTILMELSSIGCILASLVLCKIAYQQPGEEKNVVSLRYASVLFLVCTVLQGVVYNIYVIMHSVCNNKTGVQHVGEDYPMLS